MLNWHDCHHSAAVAAHYCCNLNGISRVRFSRHCFSLSPDGAPAFLLTPWLSARRHRVRGGRKFVFSFLFSFLLNRPIGCSREQRVVPFKHIIGGCGRW